jgi:hypothetical protein
MRVCGQGAAIETTLRPHRLKLTEASMTGGSQLAVKKDFAAEALVRAISSVDEIGSGAAAQCVVTTPTFDVVVTKLRAVEKIVSFAPDQRVVVPGALRVLNGVQNVGPASGQKANCQIDGHTRHVQETRVDGVDAPTPEEGVAAPLVKYHEEIISALTPYNIAARAVVKFVSSGSQVHDVSARTIEVSIGTRTPIDNVGAPTVK